MAYIQAQGFFDRMESAMRSDGLESFQYDYLDALNYALADIANYADMETRPSLVQDTSDDIELDDKYAPVLKKVVMWHLVDMGERPSDKRYNHEAEWRTCKRMIAQILRTELIETQTDPDNSIIGNGSLTVDGKADNDING